MNKLSGRPIRLASGIVVLVMLLVIMSLFITIGALMVKGAWFILQWLF